MGTCNEREAQQVGGEESKERETDMIIRDWMLDEQIQDSRVKRLLLLGAGSSGKSTLFKQLKCINSTKEEDIFEEKEYFEARAAIRRNCLSGILLLLKKSQEFVERDPGRYKDLKVNLDKNLSSIEDKEEQQMIFDIQMCIVFHRETFDGPMNMLSLEECRKAQSSEQEDEDPEYVKQWLLTQYSKGVDKMMSGEQPKLDWKLMNGLAHAIERLWNNQIWKKTYQLRGVEKFAIIENIDYFFERANSLFRHSYVPTIEDIIKVRIRTTGIIEAFYEIRKKKDDFLHIFDVGGQRSERRKWIERFTNVTAVIFVAALHHYCAVLFEDERINAMHESLNLFEEICNHKHFRTTEMILFLNGDDLFQARLKEGKALTVCFNHKDWDYTGEIYEGPNYMDPMDIRPEFYMKVTEKGSDPVRVDLRDGDDKKWFDYVYFECLKFIHKQYIGRNGNPRRAVFLHITNATSSDSIQKVFWDVQSIVFRSNLKRSGLV